MKRFVKGKIGASAPYTLGAESAAASCQARQSAATHWSASAVNGAAEDADDVSCILQLSDFMQIGPDLLQYALSVAEIFSLVNAKHSYAIDVLDNILVYVNSLNNE